MRRSSSPRLALVVLAALFVSLAHGQDKVALAIKGKEGSIGRYTSETTIELQFGGEKAVIVSKETSKVTVMKVAEDGTVTFEHKPETSEQSINGEKMPGDEKGSTSTETVRKDGTLVSLKEDPADEDEDHLGVRIWLAQAPVFKPEPVGVGDKWTHAYKPDATLGSKSADATFTLLGFEDVSGVKCAKIQMDYHENGSSPALTSKVTMWVEIASGDVIKGEYQFEGVPFPGPSGTVYATAKGSGQRTAGGPIPESGPAASAEPEGKKIDDVTKGCEKLPGWLTLYRKRESGRLTIYMEINAAQLGKPMMLQATAGTGTAKQLVTGSPIGDMLFKLEELQPDKVTLVVPNFAVRADPGSEVERAVRRSFADSFVEQFNVEARSKERNSLLIDVSDLFRGDISRLSNAFQSSGPFGLGGPGYSLDREKTFVSSLKVFPENMVVETVYNLMGSGAPTVEDLIGAGAGKGDPRSLSVSVVYNLFPVPTDSKYVPRLYDSRIGYFATWFQDFSRTTQNDQQVQYVHRWAIHKADPGLAVSPPNKPIVFWLDNAIPKEYRDPIRDGILVWNQAFEKIGIQGAIEVRQMPDDADWDPSDMRYNTVRWVTSADDAYAVSQERSNPITGEIINGNILVDANLVRALVSEKTTMIDPASFGAKPLNDARQCRLVQNGMLQAQVGLIVAANLDIKNRVTAQEYIRQFLHNVVTHEFGHMLGLRHNFAGSTQLSLGDLKVKSKVGADQPSASVMDYVPFNVSAIDEPGVSYYGQGLGKYDFWAIEYGYRDFGKSSTEAEKSDLRALASKGNTPGHAFQTDESADGFDPYVTRFDLGSDPLSYWTTISDLSRSLVKTLGIRRPAQGESYYALTRELQLLLGFQAKSAVEATRFVGGLRKNANYRGDDDEQPPLEPLPFDVQSRALDLVCARVLSAGAFAVPKSYLTKLAGDPNLNLAESAMAPPSTFPVFDLVTSFQAIVLSQLMAPERMGQVVNNEYKSRAGSKAVKVEDVFTKVQQSVWSELGTAAPVDALRRELQRNHLQLLIRYANRPPFGLPADARMWAWQGLRELRPQIVKARGKSNDRATQVHFDQCVSRIDRALNAVDTGGN